MNKLQEAFLHHKAFIPFITCGDPSLEVSKEIIITMAHQGADIIELGIPFSDPTAEGETIQKASYRALKQGVTTDKIFQMVEDVRKEITTPLVFMTYANVVFSYGIKKFLSKCQAYAIQGLILPDVPYEEKDEFEPICQEYGVDFISLIAPTSAQRIEKIAKEATGFIYVVSSLGTTGVRKEIKSNVKEIVKTIKTITNVPCAVGFGISTPHQAKEIASFADGIIVGSRIVEMIEEYKDQSPEKVKEYVKSMKDAIANLS